MLTLHPRQSSAICVLALLLVLPTSLTALPNQDDPLRLTLTDFERKNQELLKRFEAKVEVRLRDVVDAMRKAVVKLKGNQDAANANWLEKELQNLTGKSSLLDRVEAFMVTPPPLATGIHGVVLKFEEDMLEVNREHAKEQAEHVQKLLKQLERHFASLKNKPRPLLEQAQKLRADIMSVPNPQFRWFVPDLPKNHDDAKLLWERTQKEFKIEADREVRRSTIAMFVQLYELRVEAVQVVDKDLVTQLDRIAEAFRKSTLPPKNGFAEKPFENKEGFFGLPSWDAPANWIKRNRRDLPIATYRILDSHAQECEDVQKRLTSSRLELNKKWKSFAQRELIQVMNSDSTWQARKDAVQQFLSLEEKSLRWSTDRHEHPLPASSPDVMKELKRFDEETRQRLQAADERDTKQRTQLMAKLGPVAGESESERLDRESLLEILQSEAASGLRGTLLIEPLMNLAAPVRDMVLSYTRQSDEARLKLEKTHRSELDAARKKIEKTRGDLLRDAKFEEALLIDAHLQMRERPFLPVWVRGASVPRPGLAKVDYENTYPCRLLGREGDLFLLEGPIGGQSLFPRQGLVFSWREIQQSANELESLRFDFLPYKVNNDHPPSRPIGDQDTLKSGQEVLVCRFRGWHNGTIVDSSPFGFVVDISTYRDSPVVRDLVPRNFIRLTLPNP